MNSDLICLLSLVHLKRTRVAVGTRPTTVLLTAVAKSQCMHRSTEGDCKKRICIAWGLQTCMLTRELIWESVAPSHVSITPDSDWPELHTVYVFVRRCFKVLVTWTPLKCHTVWLFSPFSPVSIHCSWFSPYVIVILYRHRVNWWLWVFLK